MATTFITLTEEDMTVRLNGEHFEIVTKNGPVININYSSLQPLSETLARAKAKIDAERLVKKATNHA